MTTFSILNNVEHQNTHVIPQRETQIGNHQMCASLTIGEFHQAQRDYPIVFYREPDSTTLHPMALLGLQQDQNLFIDEAGWGSNYIPAIIEKGPFKISQQQKSDGDIDVVISIQHDDPRVVTEGGVPLFLPAGGSAPYTEHIAGILNTLYSQHESTHDFCQHLQALSILEPFSLEVPRDNEAGIKLTGFYTINDVALSQLDDQQLLELQRTGYLALVYFCIASMANISRLVNKLDSAGTGANK